MRGKSGTLSVPLLRAPSAFAALFLASSPEAAQADPTVQSDRALIEELFRQVDRQERRIAELEAQLSSSASAASTKGASAGNVVAATNSAEPTIKLRGRLQVDGLLVNSSPSAVPTPTGTQVRRFNLGAEGRLGSSFRYSAEANFAGGRVGLEDILFAYQPSGTSELVAGYTKPPNMMDELTSDNLTIFLERSAYSTAFGPGRRVGAAAHLWGRNWGIRAGIYGERDDAALDVAREEAWLASARLHGDLLPDPEEVLHVAISGYYTQPSATDPTVRISQRPEANRALPLLDTGALDVQEGLFTGIEAGLGAGPLTAQVEGGLIDFNGPSVSPRFWGYSTQIAWRWTGETRPYDARYGVFGRVTPARPLDGGGIGTLETGFRISHVDLDSRMISGGRLTSYSAVLNWFPISRIRLSGNFIHARHNTIVGLPIIQDIVTVRGQVDW